MRALLFISLAALPLVEIALLVQVGKALGLWLTLLIIIVSAAAGAYLLNRQGFAVMNRVVETMAAGKPPVAPVIDGGFLLLAGLLLMTPGLITDAIGLLLLIPQLRHAVAAWSVRSMFRSFTVRTTTFRTQQTEAPWPGERPKAQSWRSPQDATYAPGEGPVIDGEFERLDERTLEARRRSNGDGRHRDEPPEGRPPPRH